MKFRQRQILVSFGLFCFGVVVFLHTRTPDGNDTDQVVEANRRDARAFFAPKAVTLSRHGGGGGGGGGGGNAADAAEAPKREDPASKISAEEPGVKNVPGRASAAVPLVFVNQSSSSDCPTLLRPENVQETQVFQKVDGSPSLLEFSAFLDVEQAMVRVVGLSVTRGTSVFCLLWYRPGDPAGGEPAAVKELRVQQGRLVVLPEHHGRKYTAHFIECPLPDASQRPYPYAVSVTSKDCRQGGRDVTTSQPSNVLPVLQYTGKLQRNFTVCVTALNYRYSKVYELVEMIELNRLLGAQLFTFYVHSIGDNVAKVLRWYESRGLVQLVAWDLPMAVDHWPPAKQQPEVHYFAQLASHNDCLNRHRGVSRYLVYQDLDEFIIPKQTTTWAQLLDVFKDRSDSGFLFRCVFFRKEWPANSENFTGRGLADKFRSIVLATDKREPTIYPFNHRAKYIVDPLKVQTVGIHNVWKYRGAGSGGRMTQVSERQALLHHYRSWENPGDAGKAVRDTDIYRFKDRLLKNLEERWSQLPQVPLDIPLSQYGQV